MLTTRPRPTMQRRPQARPRPECAQAAFWPFRHRRAALDRSACGWMFPGRVPSMTVECALIVVQQNVAYRSAYRFRRYQAAHRALTFQRQPSHRARENAYVGHSPHPYQDRSRRERECGPRLESRMRAAHDSAERVHFGKATALQGRARIHLVFGMGFRGRDRGLSQRRCPQGDRAPHARAQRRQGGGQALRSRAIASLRREQERRQRACAPMTAAAQLMWTSAPPSTGSATPVMKSASSEARNSAAFATSQAVPILCRSGTRLSRAAATSARLFPLTRARVSTAIGVSMRPGRMTLARMPNSAFWMAICWVKATIPALLAL